MIIGGFFVVWVHPTSVAEWVLAGLGCMAFGGFTGYSLAVLRNIHGKK